MTGRFRPVVIKTYREVAFVIGVISMTAGGGLFLFCTFGCGMGRPIPALTILTNLGAATFFCIFALYLFGMAIWRPVALRMDEHGLSGYYCPPVQWKNVREVAVYRQKSGGTFFTTTYIGIKLTHAGALYSHEKPRQYERGKRIFRLSGYHVLVPQYMLKDFSAYRAVSQAQVFLKEAERRADAARAEASFS